MMQQVPAWLSGERAIQIYQEIKELTMRFVEEVSLSTLISVFRNLKEVAAVELIYSMLRMRRPMSLSIKLSTQFALSTRSRRSS